MAGATDTPNCSRLSRKAPQCVVMICAAAASSSTYQIACACTWVFFSFNCFQWSQISARIKTFASIIPPSSTRPSSVAPIYESSSCTYNPQGSIYVSCKFFYISRLVLNSICSTARRKTFNQLLSCFSRISGRPKFTNLPEIRGCNPCPSILKLQYRFLFFSINH